MYTKRVTSKAKDEAMVDFKNWGKAKKWMVARFGVLQAQINRIPASSLLLRTRTTTPSVTKFGIVFRVRFTNRQATTLSTCPLTVGLVERAQHHLHPMRELMIF